MKILHAHPELKSGGIQSMIVALANEMCKRNDVTFLSIFEPLDSHLFLRRLDKSVRVVTTHKQKNGFELGVLWRIFKAIKAGHYDVVNIHGMFYYYVFAIFLLHRKVKFFYTIHSEAHKEDFGWDKKLYHVRQLYMKLGWIRPITISKRSDESFFDYYGIRGHLIYNGTPLPHVSSIDLDKYKITPYTRILLNVGRISEPKNQVMLCRVCSKLISEGYDIVMLIIGPNQEQEIFDAMSPYFSDRIIYLGESDKIADYMSACDAFCLSSTWEGMPVTLLEAMSVGCISICTPVGGIPEVIKNGENSFIAKSVTDEDYYQSIIEYFNKSDEELDDIKSEWQKTFKDFDIKNTALSYERFYLSE